MLATDFCPERTGGVYITGGSPGSADGPYLLAEGSATNTCTIHTAPVSVEAPPPDIQEPIKDSEKENKKDKEKDSTKKRH